MGILSDSNTESDLAARALGVLRCVARIDSNKRYIVRKNGVPLITSWMRSHMQHPLVVSKACIAMANLVMDALHEQTCVEHGGIELTLQAMRTHATSVSVQTDAASLLCNLAFTSRYTGQLLAGGAVELVLAAMKQFPDDVFLLEECCGCIRNLAGGSHDNAVTVHKAGALPLVLSAMQIHSGNAKLIEV